MVIKIYEPLATTGDAGTINIRFDTTASNSCRYPYGHCFHESTAVGLYYCCRCGEIRS